MKKKNKNSKSVERALQQKVEDEKQWLEGSYGLFQKTQRTRKNFTNEELDIKGKEETEKIENAKNYFNNSLNYLAKHPVYSIQFPFKILHYTNEQIHRYINKFYYPRFLSIEYRERYTVEKKIERVRELIEYCKKDKTNLTKFINRLKRDTIEENGFNKYTRDTVVKQSLENINILFDEYNKTLEVRKKCLETMLKKLEEKKDCFKKRNEVKEMKENQEMTRNLVPVLEENVLSNIEVNQNIKLEQQQLSIQQQNYEKDVLDKTPFHFIEVTDIEKCKEVALDFLKIPVTNLQNHPIFGDKYVRRGKKYYDLTQNPNIVKRIISEKTKEIKEFKNYIEFSCIFIEKWQKINFLQKTKSYVNQKDFSKFLKIFIFNLQNHPEHQKIALEFLKESNKEDLMNLEENKKYNELEDSVIIYKTLKEKDDRDNLNSIEWDLNFEFAKKKANRVNPYIYKARIDKANIFCYCSYWNKNSFSQQESLIIDFTKIYDLELVEKVFFLHEETIKKQYVIGIANEKIDKIMKIDLSICEKYEIDKKFNSELEFEKDLEKINNEVNRLKKRIINLEELQRKIQRKKNRAYKYLRERKKNEHFKKIAYLECSKYVNKKYISQMKCLRGALFVYKKKLLKLEKQMKKLKDYNK